jgi:hypothetical protein
MYPPSTSGNNSGFRSWPEVSDPGPWTDNLAESIRPRELIDVLPWGSRRPENTVRPQPQSVQSAPGAKQRKSILHTKTLPNCELPLNQALVHFETEISPWKDPGKWVIAESEHIHSVVKDIAKLEASVEIEQAHFQDRLIIYPVSCRLHSL